MSTVTCQQCEGRGYITTQERKTLGRASNGEPVYSRFTAPINRRCEGCKGRRVVEGEAGQPAPSDVQNLDISVTFGGHRVDAPGFSCEQFERAISRALVDQLEIHETNGRHIVSHKGLTTGYHVTRTSCTCKAGEVATPCKHRALVCFHLDVREPALRRQWAALERSGKAVAA